MPLGTPKQEETTLAKVGVAPKQEETTLAKVGVEKLKMDIVRAKPFFPRN